MARYMLLIHGDEDAWDAAEAGDRATTYEAYGMLFARMREDGHLIEADELHRAGDATIVRVRDGTAEITDGPFAETKEQLGGYFLVECDLDTAIGYAAAIPGAATGTVEVRPVASTSA